MDSPIENSSDSSSYQDSCNDEVDPELNDMILEYSEPLRSRDEMVQPSRSFLEKSDAMRIKAYNILQDAFTDLSSNKKPDHSGEDLPKVRWAIYNKERQTYRWSSEGESDGSYLILSPINPLSSYSVVEVLEKIPTQIEFSAKPEIEQECEEFREFMSEGFETIEDINLPEVRWAVYDPMKDIFRWTSEFENHEYFLSESVSYLILQPNPIKPINISAFPKNLYNRLEEPVKRNKPNVYNEF